MNVKWKVIKNSYVTNPHMPWPPTYNGNICTTKTSSQWRNAGSAYHASVEKAYREMERLVELDKRILYGRIRNFQDGKLCGNGPIPLHPSEFRIRMHVTRSR